ncbi:MAG: hypothetical protein KGJ78_06195 [Alphaproteobacteria bacterium]|nr:hypothetical protein [Alphaproteobacteria bacterium]
MTRWTTLVLVLFFLGPAAGQEADPFADGANGAKLHTASGFVCPLQIGSFERDAVGQRDPQTGADYCSYSALDGVYGTITLQPLPQAYDPVALLAPDFVVQEGTGTRMIGEDRRTVGAKARLSIYTRTYETARLQNMQYRTLFTSGAVGAWAVDVTIEYADPRDRELETAFLNAVYDAAVRRIGAAP